ncbi:unnamed protein product, partial [Closterium sp. NIES-53]
VSASGQVAPPCSWRLLSHQTLLWHRRLGHPSLPHLRGMHCRLLVSGLPRSLPPLPPSPAPPCLPCIEGQQRAPPHSSSFPPTSAPLRTLHIYVWGPARVSGQGRERYFLLVVDDYTRYTTVFPFRSKGWVPDVFIPWIRAVRLQLCERFRQDLPVLLLHSYGGGEFFSDLLRDFCRGEGILQSFTLPASPQQNGIPEHRIGLVMEVACTSMIHAAAPHFLWPFAVQSGAASPPSVGGECALGTGVLEDGQEDFECLADTVPRFASMLLAREGDLDALDIPTPRCYAEHSFLAEQPARGDLAAPPTWLHWVVSRRTTLAALGFAPSTADPSLFLRTDTSLPPFYILIYVDDLVFATANTEALTLVKLELKKRHTFIDLGELRSYLGLQKTRDRARRTITLTQSHMVHKVLQRFSFQFSSPQPTTLSTGHSLSVPPSDESVEPSGPYSELVGCLMYLITCTRPDLAYPLSLLTRYVAPGRHRKGPVVLTGHADASCVDDSATQRSSQGYTFSLGSGSISWRSTHSSSVLGSSCEVEIYAGAMSAQELRWLTYLLTDLGEQPRSPPVLYVDNKAMIALCQEHRLEHRMKHIALRYFLARELQQRGQLRLAYAATRANIADIFTKVLLPGYHQRFSTRPCAYFASLAHCMTLLVL